MVHKSVRKSAHVHDGREMVRCCSVLIFMEMILWHGWCFREGRQQGACDAHPQPTIHRQRPTRSPSHSRPSGRHALRPPPRRASRHRNHGRLLAHVTAPLRRTCPVRCPPPLATVARAHQHPQHEPARARVASAHDILHKARLRFVFVTHRHVHHPAEGALHTA